jgi:hypothetical protein
MACRGGCNILNNKKAVEKFTIRPKSTSNDHAQKSANCERLMGYRSAKRQGAILQETTTDLISYDLDKRLSCGIDQAPKACTHRLGSGHSRYNVGRSDRKGMILRRKRTAGRECGYCRATCQLAFRPRVADHTSGAAGRDSCSFYDRLISS